LLGFHPVFQLLGIALAIYAAWLGIQRTRSLHFGQPDRFRRDRHAMTGSLALLTIIGGAAGGIIMVARVLERPILDSLHGMAAMAALPFLLFVLLSGFYLYLNPGRRTVLPLAHAFNNLAILLFALFQIYSGIRFYLSLLPG